MLIKMPVCIFNFLQKHLQIENIYTIYIYTSILLSTGSIHAQNWELRIVPDIPEDTLILNEINFERFHQTQAEVVSEIDTLLYKLHQQGFLESKVIKVEQIEKILFTHFSLGIGIKTVIIETDLVFNKKMLESFEIVPKKNTVEIPYVQVENFLKQLSKDFYQNGDPFAQVRIVNLSRDGAVLKADLEVISSEKLRTIDEIYVKGYEKFPQGFVKHGLGLSKGDLFTEESLLNSESVVSDISFVQQTKSPEVLFSKDSTYLYYYLDKKQSSFFDGLIGFTSDNEEDKLIFNGYLDLKLVNIFHKGETNQLFWQNNGQSRREFKIYSQWPYVFGSKFSTEFHFDLYQQDSTFNQISTLAGLSYPIKQNAKLGLLFDYTRSNNLEASAADAIESYDRIGLRLNYGLKRPFLSSLNWDKFYVESDLLLANRSAETMSNEQFLFTLTSNYSYEFSPKTYLFIQLQGGYLFSETYFTNELFRVGGTETIRGFREQAFFTNFYGILNLEARFRTNNTDYFHTVTDLARVENELLESNNTLLSLGLGYTLMTKMGRIQLTYAVGKIDQEPFNFNQSAFHIKVQNNF